MCDVISDPGTWLSFPTHPDSLLAKLTPKKLRRAAACHERGRRVRTRACTLPVPSDLHLQSVLWFAVRLKRALAGRRS